MKQRNKPLGKITVKDYLKAVKKADREIQLTNRPGWSSTDSVHKSAKHYDRKRDRKIDPFDE
jgi:hypothetical protein